ncbi:hypothetical protein X474_16140 [Dethiosulfatarculus sandiegensis]|uniref:Uncharacterized protein n=1 Tax=Dethiosulfatarculus sandiegensis TaxID=1429043 RepID=A0A0D2J4D4_9BACT|nr:hypothetical protein X474_16140 [Dethiosulfatarculus sandiegensis]
MHSFYFLVSVGFKYDYIKIFDKNYNNYVNKFYCFPSLIQFYVFSFDLIFYIGTPNFYVILKNIFINSKYFLNFMLCIIEIYLIVECLTCRYVFIKGVIKK